MIVLENPLSHVSGVFETQEAAKNYLNSIDLTMLDSHWINHFDFSYPLYIYEVSRDFDFYGTKEEVLERIKEAKSSGEQFNHLVTTVDKDWHPENAGKDEMGYLNHDHVARCGNCKKFAPGNHEFMEAYTKEELEDTCKCDKATW